MSLIDRWLEDSKHPFFWVIDPNGEQRLVDGNKIRKLNPEDKSWDHRFDKTYYAHHPEAKKPKNDQ